MISTFYPCPRCGAEIECEVDIGEHDIEFPDECPNGHLVTEKDQLDWAGELEADAMGSAIDRATDLCGGDR